MAGAVNLPLLTSEVVCKYLKWHELIPAMEKALGNFSKGPSGGVVQPVRTTIEISKHNGYLMNMPSYSSDEDVLATKLVSIYAGNANLGLPTHNALIALFDAGTGIVKALLDGDEITAMRTAAVSAVATKYLAEKEPQILAILGVGIQGRSHFNVLTHLFRFKEVRVWSQTHNKAATFASDINQDGIRGFARACSTVEEAVLDADVIVTATLATSPILQSDWVKSGAHINGIGACRPDWQELSPELVNRAVVYVDSREAAMKEAGDIIQAKASIYAEIGEVINETKRACPEKITFFKSLGMAIEDAVAANLVFQGYSKEHK